MDIITAVGKNAVAEKIGGLGSVSDFTYLALGYDGDTATVSDTTLGEEATDSGLARSAATVTTDSANVLQLVHTWTASATKTLRECGVLNDATAGVLLAHSDFNSISVDSDDSIQITYKITVS